MHQVLSMKAVAAAREQGSAAAHQRPVRVKSPGLQAQKADFRRMSLHPGTRPASMMPARNEDIDGVGRHDSFDSTTMVSTVL